MVISYTSRDLDWTEPMQEWVTRQIAEPLVKFLKSKKFYLSVHWELARTKNAEEPQNKYEMWTVLQTYDGRGNRIVRREGNDFCNLTEDVGQCLRSAL